MPESHPNDDHRQAFNKQLIQALDDLVETIANEGARIQAGIASYEERKRRGEFDMRERPPAPDAGGINDRFDRLDERFDELANHITGISRDLADVKREVADVKREVADVKREVSDIRERMATKVELEETNENVKKMADGYVTMGRRLDAVAELLKVRVVFP